MKYPKVSAIIPVKNGERFLKEAVRSIASQNYQPLEIIIVDDSSTDKTAQIAKKFPKTVTYIYQKNKGIASARNTGIFHATGSVVAFLDVDDLWTANKLKSQVIFLLKNPEVDVVLGLIQRAKYNGHNLEKIKEKRKALSVSLALFRKSTFQKVGLFDETKKACEDIDWFLRARGKGVKMQTLNQVTLLYRRHSANMTNNQNLINNFLLKTLKENIERKKKS